MDSGLTVKPVGAAQASSARLGSFPTSAAVATELAASLAVTAAQTAAAPAGHDAPRTPPDPQQMSREVLIDPQTREVMFRTMFLRSGRTAGETPEEATLKLRAYRRAEPRKRDADGNTVAVTA